MNKLFAVAGVALLKTWKEKTFLIIMIATALIFTSISSIIFGGEGGGVTQLVPVGIADLDGSGLSRKMIEDLQQTGSFDVRALSLESAYESVRQGSIEAGFVIPHGFEESVRSGSPLSVTIVKLSTSNTGIVASTIMERSLTSYLLEKAVVRVASEKAAELGVSASVDPAAVAGAAAERLSRTPTLTVGFEVVTEEEVAAAEVTWAAGLSMGIYMMFTMFTVMFMAGDILNERKAGTWGRLLSTPISKPAVVGGKIMANYAVGMAQVLFLILFARYVFRINFGPNLGAVIAILALTVAVVSGLGLFLSTLVRTMAQLQTLIPIVVVSTCMLGGCYWPLEIVSPLMQSVAKATPQAWAMIALTDVTTRGRSLLQTAPNLIPLACFGLVFFLIGVARTKFE
ncbi:MAG: ABC transporter permease [Bacillota bacterium]